MAVLAMMVAPLSATTRVAPSTPVKHKGSYASDVWITDGAWMTGIAGALATLLCGFWFYRIDALGNGVSVLGLPIAHNSTDAVVLALLVIAVAMVAAELARLWLLGGATTIRRSPLLDEHRFSLLLRQSLWVYVQNLLLFLLVKTLYQSAADFPAWNQMLDVLWTVYLWGGLPYTLLTRAYQHNPDADLTDYPTLLSKLVCRGLQTMGLLRSITVVFTYNDKKTALGLVVKLFFTPIMTVFFFNQFPTMVRNIGYIVEHLPGKIAAGNYSHETFNKDFYNITKTFLLSVDVALAWVGYVVTSRWLDNQTQSAEPTLLGWSVCLLSYPPFQILGLYFSYPSESAIFQYDSPWAISFFIGLAILSYFIYMCATLAFGVRFSNLTHRGIIRKGPYAIVRHPAYASKNLSWWLVILPAILMNIDQSGYLMAAVLTVGLAVQTWIYYMRAITEERHLSADPRYLEYCEQVKYRFIPGII